MLLQLLTLQQERNVPAPRTPSAPSHKPSTAKTIRTITGGSRRKYHFCRDKSMLAATKPLLRQKWYLWQLLPMIQDNIHGGWGSRKCLWGVGLPSGSCWPATSCWRWRRLCPAWILGERRSPPSPDPPAGCRCWLRWQWMAAARPTTWVDK